MLHKIETIITFIVFKQIKKFTRVPFISRVSLKLFLVPCLIAIFFSSCAEETIKEDPKQQEEIRIISLSGFLTETLFDLGYGENIVGLDVTSTYPSEKLADIPKLGHVSQLNLEAILGLNPSLVFIEKAQLGQAKNLSSLGSAGVKVVSIPTTTSLNNVLIAMAEIQKHLDIDEAVENRIAETIGKDSLALEALLTQAKEKPRVLFIYARGTGRLMVGGNNTPMAAMIEKAGGQNAIQSFDNYKALSPEALVEAAPDVILMFTSGLASLDGKDGLAQITGIPQTAAYQNDRIIAMDGHYLASFSSRAGKAAIELATQLQNPLNE